jgi:catechol 2,3-dioxygenase-like lactoylglutathione lyase family enzyme
MITSLGHVALRVPDLEASVRHATEILGLLEVERTGNSAYLTQPSHLTYPTPHHSVQYIQGDEAALDHIGLRATDEAALGELRVRLAAAGVEVISDVPEGPGIAAAIRFAGPDGHVLEVFAGMEERERRSAAHAIKPRRLGHVTFKVETIGPTLALLTDVLGFKVSDYVYTGGPHPSVAFLRCNPLHHTIGLIEGPPGLHHYAFEVATLQELGLLGDVLDRAGGRYVWGPGRHGAGDNIAAYHLDPAGVMVEHYADMQLIFDDAWEPRSWSVDDHRATNTWGPIPQDDPSDFGVGLVAPSSRAQAASDTAVAGNARR